VNSEHKIRQLNRQSKIPLYHQLYEILRDYISGGDWPPGFLVPPESELCRHYEVSQITARQALDNLVNEGLIYRQRGRGTFVAQPAIEATLTRIISFAEDMRRRGFEPASRLLFSETVEASPFIADKLQVKPGEELAQVHRLRFADQEPLSVERASLVHRFCRGVLNGDYEKSSLRKALSSRFGIRLTRARQSIRAQSAGPDLASLLSVEPGSALLSIERVSFSQHNIPVEFLQIFYRADRYVLYTELQG
jgi:GntR family transcriptional regulator